MRAVALVQALLTLGVMVAVPSWRSWLVGMSVGTAVTQTALLLWLVSVCALGRWLVSCTELLQWSLLMAFGALCTALGCWLLLVVDPQAFSPAQQLGAMLSGAVVAGLLLAWLKLRSRAQMPADALARLVELQSRIRPHFLFNTLNTAMALVRVDPAQAEQVLEDLSELFRVALAPQGSSVTLAQEVELARRYLDIELIRFGPRLRVQWLLDDGAGAARVPPLFLQPLVENAVRYGVEPNEAGGHVRIETRLRGGEVEVLVRNSVGASTRTRGHGFALTNVRERLRLMHDVAARMDVRAYERHFAVRIRVPRSGTKEA
ncbi:sensor histidine kinase [Roseateles sp. BYS180W]|uniref:Sensor histidine kinase n=1 Tax=Roseateles rivi TaxID=3299028 RepID=A0ABW7FVN2_9BURK